jgi:4-amino-4-deoxy-L-arabinose transferase-like glycosyltransferase
VGILAAAGFCCTPLFSAIATKTMVDIPVGYYAFLALYTLFRYMEKNDYKTLVLMGITAGFTSATKHTGLVVVALLFITVLILEIKRNRFSILTFKHIILFGIIILLIPAPWYIRSFIYTGKFITTNYTIQGVIGVPVNQNVFDKILKVITNFINYVLFKMLFDRSLSRILWGVGTFILAFVPCLALVKGIDKSIKLILIYSVSGLLLFSIISNIVRFSVPVYASLSIVGAYTVYWLLSNYKSLTKFIQIIILAFFLLNIIPLANLTFKVLPVISGLETKEHYLNRMIRIYDVIEYINNNLDNDVKILNMDSRGYYFEKPYVNILTFSDVYKSMPELLERLKKEKVTHLFCNENYSNTGYSPLPKELKSHIKLIYSSNRTYLYRFDWYNKP